MSSDQLSLADGSDALVKIYVNFHTQIEAYREMTFAAEIDKTEFKEAGEIKELLKLVVSEDIRLLVILICSYSDSCLEKMFRAYLPSHVPGGVSTLFGAFGPLASFSNRIKLASAFQLVSVNLIQNMDSLRKVRNDLAHNWNSPALSESESIINSLDRLPIDIFIIEEQNFIEKYPQFEDINRLDATSIFRIRLVFYTISLFYETSYYAMGKKRRLVPESVLFGKHHPKRLVAVSRLAIEPATQILEQKIVSR